MRSNNVTPSKMITPWHQQVFALDAKYNSQRAVNNSSLAMLYIRRRSQLLRDKACKDPELQNRYLKLRSELLRRRYGTCLETSSLPSEKSFEIKGRSRTSSKKSTAESFAGVHHVFDQHSAAISMLKFGNNDRSRFCCASFDGTISICEATTTPPKVVVVLHGHMKGVTAIDWSMSNDLLVSTSLDATIRLWKIHPDSKTDCLRVAYDQLKAETLCCAFAPTNNNLVLAGNSQGLLEILNVSTGKYTKGGTMKIGGKITSLICEESGGSLVWTGNDRGIIASFRLEPGLGKLTKLRRMEGTGGVITSLSWRPWLSKDFPWPTLLVSSACNAVLLFRVADDQGNLVLWKRYPIRHRQYLIRSTFCPQMGTSLIATGSEDGSIHLLDSAKDGKSAQVNRLLGHSAPTLTLSFNYDESVLASGDHQGLVILWNNHHCQQ
ncbi:hypothetical protein TSAR_000365 [Trichomalopsis sarcophagae]|uniref:Uncharacterized protein n=1 Tax=Trichomalopsis sarcophagae TaxID=543379 RepID=A0A232F015_9HYME|nr:hypothetical protein TSAR_000365 [Trichomalopsis sarcophagae]